MKLFDTVAAVSTPRGKGGVALIRISGSDAVAVGERVFSRRLSLAEPRVELYGRIFEPLPNGERRELDDGMAVVFRAPASFTGEDTVELTCHGGVLVTQRVLAACIAAGARQATAGEFTRRAFLNGKLSLDRAESLGALLEAGTAEQLALARSGLDGRLSDTVEKIYSSLLDVSAELRADIDFPDEDVSDMTADELRASISSALTEAVRLGGSYSVGRAVSDGVVTVVCGHTNAGKSSLFNRLVGQDSAIVTDIEGTTRDLLTERVSCGGVTLLLTDTAGLRGTDDPIERIGVDRARSAIDRAELIIAVFDGSRPMSEEDTALATALQARKESVIAVINKSDLPDGEAVGELARLFPDALRLSALTGEGLDRLATAVASRFNSGGLDPSRDPIIATARQYGAVTFACDMLREALEGLDCGLPVDLVCSSLERAMESLAEIGGRQVSEDIVSGIFSKFCVGK